MPDNEKKETEEVIKTATEAVKEAVDVANAEISLEEKVKDKMNDIFGSDDMEDTDDTEDTDVTDDIDDTDVTDDTDYKDAVTDNTTSESGKKTDDDTLTLPASHIQTALRLGMSEDKVKDLFDKDPEFMITALKELHAGENKLSAQYAQMGRAVQKDKIAKQEHTANDDEPSPKSFVDLKKLRGRFDDDDEEAATLIEGIVKPLNDALVKMQSKLDARVQPDGQPAYNQQEELAIQSEVNNFFDNDQLKDFREYYGTVKPGQDPRVVLTGAQFNHRGDVCSQGNFIRIGADVSGQQLTISDVLHRAHLQLTEPMREEMIRENISSKIKKRASGLSLKAGKKKVPDGSPEEDPVKQLEVTTKARLKKVFG